MKQTAHTLSIGSAGCDFLATWVLLLAGSPAMAHMHGHKRSQVLYGSVTFLMCSVGSSATECSFPFSMWIQQVFDVLGLWCAFGDCKRLRSVCRQFCWVFLLPSGEVLALRIEHLVLPQGAKRQLLEALNTATST